MRLIPMIAERIFILLTAAAAGYGRQLQRSQLKERRKRRIDRYLP